MNTNQLDPIGQAILDFTKSKKTFDIIVEADLCDDDIIPIETLFRNFNEMPLMEQKAMQLCKGKILDVGACAGPHSRYLSDSGFKVTAIDVSPGAVLYLNEIGINAHQADFFNFQPKEQYDTILMLMNGIGMAGTIANLKKTLLKASSLLKPGGQVLCDSSDVKFLYEEEDGSFWMDLNTNYYGEFKFKMKYKKIEGPWFDWLYVDYDKLHKAAVNCGFKSNKIEEQEHHYLAQLILA